MEPYAEFRKRFMARLSGLEPGDPNATAEAILKLVDANDPPLRLALGDWILPGARTLYADCIATWEAWEDVSNTVQGQQAKQSH
jgi:hypothetical protein